MQKSGEFYVNATTVRKALLVASGMADEIRWFEKAGLRRDAA